MDNSVSKIHLVVSLDNNGEESVMYSNIDNTEFLIYENADEVIKEVFQSAHSRYQIESQTLVRSSNFIFDGVYLLHRKCQKTNFKCGRSYIDSPNWTKIKKSKKKSFKKSNNKCFQYPATMTLNYEKIGKNHDEITKINSFISE